MANGIPVSPKDVVDIADMHVRGISQREIGRVLNLSKTTVHNAIHYNDECKKLIQDMRDSYASELLTLSMDIVREKLLDEDINQHLLYQYVVLGMKYSGMEQGASKVKVEQNQTVKLSEISLEDLKKINYK